MISLRLLLIEDTDADATLFINQIQDSLGDEVEVDWKTRLSEALAVLEAGARYDQIWLDPGLPDLKQAGIGTALSTLKRYVPKGELRLISSGVAPTVTRQAAIQEVQVLGKDALTSRDSEILRIVGDLLSKRTSSTTSKVATFKIEKDLAILQHQVEANTKQLEKAEATLERLGTIGFELGSVKKAIGQIPALQTEIKTLKAAKGSSIELSKMRWQAIITLATALITAVVSIAGIIVTKQDIQTIERQVDSVAPTPSSSPSVPMEAPGTPDANPPGNSSPLPQIRP